MSAHQVDRSDVNTMFLTECLYTTGKQPAHELIEV